MARYGRHGAQTYKAALLMSLSLVAGASIECKQPKPSDPMTGNASTPPESPAIELDWQEGIVTQLPGSDQYAVNFSVAGTIDCLYTGLIDDLDDALRQPGLKVRVTGRLLKTPDLPSPVLGGQEMFRLEVSEIARAN